VLTIGAWLLLSSVFALVAAWGGVTPGLAVGSVVGLGLAGTVGARRVPPPADLRMGLRGFAPGLLGTLLLMLPAAVLVSEVDNWIARGLERPALLAESATGGAEATEETATTDAPGEKSAADPGLAAVEVDAGVDPTDAAGAAAGEAGTEGDPRPSLPTDWLSTAEWVLFAVALRPVLEEFFFRGVVQQGVVAHLGVARGLLLTTVLFAALRASLGLGDAYAFATLGIQALLVGLLLGLVRLASGSILPGILLQGGLAATGVGGLLLAESLPIPGFNAEGDHTPLGVLIPCGLCVAAGVVMAVRAAGRREPVAPPVPVVPVAGSED
jgi:hypothetical protein